MTPRRLLLNLLAGVAHGSGWAAQSRRRRRRRGDYRLYILEYHDLCGQVTEEREGVVSAYRLAHHLAWLQQHFRLVTVEQGARWLSDGGNSRRDGGAKDLLAVTFDDGYVSNHVHAGPVLRAAACPATIFLATGFIDGTPLWFDLARHGFTALRGRETALSEAARRTLQTVFGSWPYSGNEVAALKYAPYEARLQVLAALRDLDLDLPTPRKAMSWQQIQELQEQGIEMGAHTLSHPILSRQSPAQQKKEICGSRQRIAEATGIEPQTFAFPNGSRQDYDDHSVKILQEAGFAACCTTVRGSNRPGGNPWTLHRLGVGSDSVAVLASRLAGLFDQGMRRFLPTAARSAPTH